MVVGNVNSTVAAGLVAKKMGTVLAHVEAGLRSGDRRMPEEINRIATDAITDVFFTTEETGTANLVREGHSMSDVHFVGHVMIDNLLYQKERLREESLPEELRMLRRRLPERYVCMTMHRPSNVDDKEKLTELLKAAKTIAEEAPVIFPCHPRTRKQIAAFGLESMLGHGRLSGTGRIGSGILMTEPLSYNAFLYFWSSAALVLTDSGGLQEETTALGIPCVTMRDSTERPVTVEIGSNVIVGADGAKAVEHGLAALSGNWKKSRVPRLWDGRASERIVDILAGRTQSVP
jgi:UDP-N-acetylglucosamine 2-epimerase (non-hydrolysing)